MPWGSAPVRIMCEERAMDKQETYAYEFTIVIIIAIIIVSIWVGIWDPVFTWLLSPANM